jgi:hypothetical protein
MYIVVNEGVGGGGDGSVRFVIKMFNTTFQQFYVFEIGVIIHITVLYFLRMNRVVTSAW